MTRDEMQAWVDAQDWPAIYAEAKRDMAEAIRQLRQERLVCPEWLWEPMI